MRILLLILTVLLLPALAQPPESREPLDPAVQAVLKSVKEKFEDQRQDLQVRLKAKRLELATLLKQDNVEKAAVKAKLDEILVLDKGQIVERGKHEELLRHNGIYLKMWETATIFN